MYTYKSMSTRHPTHSIRSSEFPFILDFRITLSIFCTGLNLHPRPPITLVHTRSKTSGSLPFTQSQFRISRALQGLEIVDRKRRTQVSTDVNFSDLIPLPTTYRKRTLGRDKSPRVPVRPKQSTICDRTGSLTGPLSIRLRVWKGNLVHNFS